jgi:hypothetical protein
MELRGSIFASTLAQKLGDTTHISPLLRRVIEAAGSAERAGDWLLKVAVDRGARHYKRDFDPTLRGDDRSLTDEEIGVALCLGHLPDRPVLIRAASQLLSSPNTNVLKLARLAAMERCQAVLLHIANAALRAAPAAEPWASLRKLLCFRSSVPDGALPHWSRFVSMSGVTREGGPRVDWLTRHE